MFSKTRSYRSRRLHGAHIRSGTGLHGPAIPALSRFESLEQRMLMSSSLWNDSTVPAITSLASPPAEVGVRFSSDTDGFITGLKFYKGPGNTGVHIGSLR